MITINVKKSSCIRIGPRNKAICVPICCLSGVSLPWVDEMRYLGIFVISSRVFKLSAVVDNLCILLEAFAANITAAESL